MYQIAIGNYPQKQNEEIMLFQEYLRIPSVHPNIDYVPCVEFLKRQAETLDLPVQVVYTDDPSKPVVVLTWVGKEPQLPAIMLNSHMDVVPVFPEKWSHPPFAAEIDAEGRIFARGSQDMKCVGMQYLAAIKALKKDGITLKRTIHIIFVPEEEFGGFHGMMDFVHTEDFKKLNIGFAFDEGYASPTEIFSVFYAERSIWHTKFIINGTAGHGSLLLKDTVGEKLHAIVDKLMSFRNEEAKRLSENDELTVGDVTTVNLTMISGGVQSNVIPPQMEIVFDIRLAMTLDFESFEKQLHQWCDEAGGNIQIEFVDKNPKVPATKLDETNPFWLAFKQAIDQLGLTIKTQVFPGGTDSRYIRKLGIPAIGFSPMNETPILLHDHDEFIKVDTYLRGIEIYKAIIPAVANV